ncbi:hypothetical protein [Streptomyces sp. ICBB 8177]|uniref:hypothetical protein n=1 Tax=Streptomyces sp. ICBB 8177 TaxID=563922 RepID=UPI0011B5C1F9|nr:hypothetical protein [Streptomyces sp. ICBB 8177]
MKQREVRQRVIGVLTQGLEWVRRGATEGPATGGGMPSEVAVVSEMISEILPPLDIPGDARTQHAVNQASRDLGRAITQIVGAFMDAFAELALEHDSADPAVTANDVLRRLAIEAETDDG